MKHTITIVLTILLWAGSALALSKLELGEADGFAESVQVSDYDEGKVRLITPDGIEEKRIGEFSEAAQQKILNWYLDDVFLSSSRLRIKIEEKEDVDEYEDRSIVGSGHGYPNLAKRVSGEIIKVNYIITLQNRSERTLKDITLTCRVYLDQWNKETEDDDLQVYTEFKFSADLPPGKKVFKTRDIPCRDYVLTRYYRDFDLGTQQHQSIPIEDKLLGIVVLVEKIAFDGQTLTRTENEGRPPKKRDEEDYSLREYEEAVSWIKELRIKI